MPESSQLSQLLTRDTVELDVIASDWREAIGHAGGLLERSGAIDHAYTQAMIDSVDEKGPWVFFSSAPAPLSSRPPWSRSPR